MRLVQTEFREESPAEAEEKWIQHYHVHGYKLANKLLTVVQSKKDITASEAEEGSRTEKSQDDLRVMVSIRNVSRHRWKAVKKLADERGLKLRLALDQMMDDWVEKHGAKTK